MPTEPVILLALASLMLYIASRTAAQALGGTLGRAVGHFIPIALVAAVAAWLKYDALAIDLLFASTAMCVTLVIGVALLAAPNNVQRFDRRTWPLFLPVVALTWMAGSMGVVDWRVALGLLGLGATFAWIAHTDRGTFPGHGEPRVGYRWVLVALSIVVAVMGAIACVVGAGQVLVTSRLVTQGILASTIIAPLLVLPILGATTEAAQNEGSSANAIGTCFAMALLNLCAGLPAIMIVRIAREYHNSGELDALMASPLPTVARLFREQQAGTGMAMGFPIPYGIWRLDTMILIMSALLLAPIGLGRWSATRLEGLLLVVFYVMYLYLVSPLGM